MRELCDLKIHINGQQTFFLSQRVVCSFSGRLKRMTKQAKRKSHGNGSVIRIKDFPGGAEGFELVSRFCYNNGRIPMNPSNICFLHCAATFLEMNEEIAPCNLLTQAETFMDGLFYWTWDEILTSLRTCDPFFSIADSSGLLQKLISSLLARISANSDIFLVTPFPSSPSSSSSTDSFAFRSSSSIRTPDIIKPCLSREWWFNNLTVLPPRIIEKMMGELGCFGRDNKSFILTRFLLHYLKSAAQRGHGSKGDYEVLADTAVHGVVLMGRNLFSLSGLFWVLRVVSRAGVNKESKEKLEWLMGSMLDMASLDDLLVSGNGDGVYDVNLVIRLVGVFVNWVENDGVPLNKMRKVGRLLDKYLKEISPDQSLKVTKFLGVAESLPDSARDCYDGVYRALDIYLESHPGLPFEERTILCRCLNLEKLTLEACKDLAKNPRIPPQVAVEALVSQQSELQSRTEMTAAGAANMKAAATSPVPLRRQPEQFQADKEDLTFNLQKMQSRVIELEKVCIEMRSQMAKMAKGRFISTSTAQYITRGLPKLC
ncbi:BTB/POZ domain-containing protein [Apostasia shenzhenica]|uniref:BTB/POZ domain-containing protein n=1 Tax=Apostasia shenzhenica TaxID=1088818 RepID=A0A2I0BBL5_9ASPA|nr:BTB/POZ domain-containing protein [Apostasia shenzhenica]